MTYNTGNPIGSNDPRDLADNAQALDRAINDAALSFTDRLGQNRMTLAGMEQAATGIPAVEASIEAKAAQAGAELARDVAQFHAGIYATTEEGIASTTNGQFFSVPGASSAVLSLYKNNSGAALFINDYPGAAIAKLGRVQFSRRGTVFQFNDPDGTSVEVGWSTLRFWKGDSSGFRRVADRPLSALAAGKALYIDVATDLPATDYAVQEADLTAISVDIVTGTKILLVGNYVDGYLVGEIAEALVNKEMQAAAAAAQAIATSAQTTANAASTNALAARRLIVGEITSLSVGVTLATISISEGKVYKENNAGSPEKIVAPLTGVTVAADYGIIVDLVGGAVDGSGRVIPTVVPIASLGQTGWQSGSKYVLAAFSGSVVHGLYKHSFRLGLLAARRLIAGQVTRADWSGASVTVSISEGRAYKEANSGLPEKIVAPLADQVLRLDECLIVDLVGGAVDGSGRVIPEKWLVAQAAAAGWQTADKYILVANGGYRILSGEYAPYIPPAASASAYTKDEVVVVQRSDEVDVYMKGSNPASLKYLRYRMQRKPGATINSDVWRWNEVWEVERTAEYSFTSVRRICNDGENEMAIKQAGKADFIGGTAHGDEELFTVTMLIDGDYVALGGTGNFRCRRVEFLQGSDMYEVDTVPPKSNRVAKSYKRWVFEAGEVELFNHVFWEYSITLTQTFMTMLTFLRWNVDVQISDKGYRSPLYLEEDISDSYKVTIGLGGTGFVDGETVTITANDGTGTGMEAIATASGGAITALKVAKNGTGYTVGEAVTISSKAGAGSGATGTLTNGFPMVYSSAAIAKASGPTGYSAEVEILDGWDKPNRRFNFSNSSGGGGDLAYNKFYFDFTGDAYVTQVGEVMRSRTRYKIDTKN